MTRLCRVLANSALATMFTISGTALAWQAAPAKSQTSPTTSKAIAPTAADIADAKSKGLVWVNTNSKVYHTSDDTKYYGKTKQGEFMSEADAQKAGFHASKEAKKKATDTSTPATKK